VSDDRTIEELMNLFEVRVDAFAICEIEKTAALRCDPFDKVVVHFVLRGAGLVEFKNGSRALRRNTVIIVPRKLAKVISGEGPITSISDAREDCPLDDQLIHFRAGDNPDLVLGCAAIDASIGGVIDVFEYLWEPMSEDAAGTTLAPLFDLIERELANPHLGTRAIVGALMKQVLIGVFRSQLSAEAYRSWLWPAMMNPGLGRAALAMMSRPQDSHTIESLAALAGMSRSRFAEHFTKAFGRRPIEFLQAARLQIAQRLLVSSSLPVKSVAAAVGYASRSHFSRTFQSKYGFDPSAFRKRSQMSSS
jgi:AraC-like DNA-binding protein